MTSAALHATRRNLLGIAALSLPAAMASRSASALALPSQPIEGYWTLASLYEEDGLGGEIGVFGLDPKGALVLDDGAFSLIVVGSTPMTSPCLSKSTTPVSENALGPGTLACFGSYIVEQSRRRLHFNIETALTRGWEGTRRSADFFFEHNKLVLVSSFVPSLTGMVYSQAVWTRPSA